MLSLLRRLESEVLVGPGSIGTVLANKGYDQTGNAQWWAINHAEMYPDTLKEFLDAGYDCVSSNVTGANKKLQIG